jgi:hypothetical protein
MGYSSQWGENADQGGPFEAGKKNPRPKNYVGPYSQPKATGPEVNQAFRPELPPVRPDNRDPSLLDGQINGTGPSFDKILKTWC